MAEVEILVKPPSKRAAREALEKVREASPQAILFSLPENVTDLVAELASGMISYEEFLEEVRGRLPEPPNAWFKGYEEILTNLYRIAGRSLDVYCYGDPLSFKIDSEKSLQLALLTLRSMVTGRINVDEWLKILCERMAMKEAAFKREAEKVAEISTGYEKSICISDSMPSHIRKRLKEKGVKLKVHYLGQPYHFTPIEILKRKLAKGDVDEEEVKHLIREHINFVREYLYRKSLPEAVEEWSMRKLYWIHGR